MLDDNFIKAVLKVMREEESNLLPAEAATLTIFLLVEETPTATADQSPKKKMKERLAEMKAARLNVGHLKSKYLLAIKRAILGSAAEVERVWSMAGRVLTKDWASMSPLVFKCIMYLKYNKELWSLADVVEANKRRKNVSRVATDIRRKINIQKVEIDNWEVFQAPIQE